LYIIISILCSVLSTIFGGINDDRMGEILLVRSILVRHYGPDLLTLSVYIDILEKHDNTYKYHSKASMSM